MFNFTEVNNIAISQLRIVKNTIFSLTLLCYCVFIYFVAIILHVFFTRPHVRENARYILFVHLILNDTVVLLAIIILFPITTYFVYIPVPLCYTLCLLPACSYMVTPYNLATMSLERYIAICYPLRHSEIWTAQRSLLAIGFIWLLGLTPQFLDFIALCISMPRGFFSTSMLCDWQAFQMSKVQEIVRILNGIITFPAVGLVILFTYVKIILVARKSGSGKSSAYKAEKTVLLHALQLILCLMIVVASTTDKYSLNNFFFIPTTNFFFFVIIPRFISPFIYGVRDEVFQKQMKKINFCM
ncbi:odorant receptor 131-2-like [Leptodactylus fuscus]|uniref:odorant receptor 131-2-like n=1 Tax=Leptodactylus fuscus TaxID=238119 RepID=UPI003F4F298E